MFDINSQTSALIYDIAKLFLSEFYTFSFQQFFNLYTIQYAGEKCRLVVS